MKGGRLTVAGRGSEAHCAMGAVPPQLGPLGADIHAVSQQMRRPGDFFGGGDGGRNRPALAAKGGCGAD